MNVYWSQSAIWEHSVLCSWLRSHRQHGEEKEKGEHLAAGRYQNERGISKTFAPLVPFFRGLPLTERGENGTAFLLLENCVLYYTRAGCSSGRWTTTGLLGRRSWAEEGGLCPPSSTRRTSSLLGMSCTIPCCSAEGEGEDGPLDTHQGDLGSSAPFRMHHRHLPGLGLSDPDGGYLPRGL